MDGTRTEGVTVGDADPLSEINAVVDDVVVTDGRTVTELPPDDVAPEEPVADGVRVGTLTEAVAIVDGENTLDAVLLARLESDGGAVNEGPFVSVGVVDKLASLLGDTLRDPRTDELAEFAADSERREDSDVLPEPAVLREMALVAE